MILCLNFAKGFQRLLFRKVRFFVSVIVTRFVWAKILLVLLSGLVVCLAKQPLPIQLELQCTISRSSEAEVLFSSAESDAFKGQLPNAKESAKWRFQLATIVANESCLFVIQDKEQQQFTEARVEFRSQHVKVLSGCFGPFIMEQAVFRS